MNFFERLIGRWRIRGQGARQRVILLNIVGLEPRSIDPFLTEGLLHNLALLSDVGTGQEFTRSSGANLAEIERAARGRQLRVQKLSGPSKLAVNLSDICRDDEKRQAELVETLTGSWSGLLVAPFDMPLRLQRLFGSQPSPGEQLVLRDTYARMDEIVGKAFSFVDESTALAVLISPAADWQMNCDAPNESLFFFSRPLNSVLASPSELAAALF
jgi:hypothetical protein